MQLFRTLSKNYLKARRFVVRWVLMAQLAVGSKQVEIIIKQHQPTQRDQQRIEKQYLSIDAITNRQISAVF